ncbi:hypothetical protein PROFUN_01331 [Planoprotostelium fungivorum]|uniref:START domain-containing protein n=1 Tax=Planoprotostelium fungivorum TaxID=1890364 RepID=A0A2P6NZW3_9EUKA|nr:hypothetical protein PROFUN_01331 [Planoprotostelium fungivorum]
MNQLVKRSSGSQLEQSYHRILEEAKYDDLELMMEELSLDKQKSLASHLSSVSRSPSSFIQLARWIVKRETSRSASPSEVFASEGIGRSFIELILNDSFSVKYMDHLLSPLIKKISEKRPGVDLRGQIGVALDQFFISMEESILSCPMYVYSVISPPIFLTHVYSHIRILLSEIDQEMKQTYGEQTPITQGLTLFVNQLLCHNLTPPKANNISGESFVWDDSSIDTIKSMIGQTIIIRMSEHQRRPSLSTWSTQLIHFYGMLVDAEDVKRAMSIVEASMSERERECKSAREDFKRFYRKMICYRMSPSSSRASVTEPNESPDMFDRMHREFVQKVNHCDWVLKKTNKNAFVYTKKEEAGICTKIVLRINSPLSDVVRVFGEKSWSTEYDSLIDRSVTTRKGQNYSEGHFNMHFSFPYSDRSFHYSQWTIWKHLSQRRVVRVMNDVGGYVSKTKGIRGQLHLSGTEYAEDKGDPNVTHVSIVFHVEVNGRMPQYMKSVISTSQVEKFVSLSKFTEKLAQNRNKTKSGQSAEIQDMGSNKEPELERFVNSVRFFEKVSGSVRNKRVGVRETTKDDTYTTSISSYSQYNTLRRNTNLN